MFKKVLVGVVLSKLYLEYIRRKKQDDSKYYLFKAGLFYIFLDDDAKEISKVTSLNLALLNKDVVKCGFPCNCLDKYMTIFFNLGLDVVIINDLGKNSYQNVNEKIIKRISNTDIDNLTPVKALNMISEFKEMISNE